MQVRMIAEITGTRDGTPWPKRNTIVDLPDDEAVALLNSRLAESIKLPAHEAPETASANTRPLRK